IEGQLPGPEPAEEVLPGVADGLEVAEAEEPGRPLDRVQGAEHPGEGFPLGGLPLQGDEVEVELREALVGLDEEFADDVVSGSSPMLAQQPGSTARAGWPGSAPRAGVLRSRPTSEDIAVKVKLQCRRTFRNCHF